MVELMENLKKCPHFNTCNQNLCPLDLELHLRSGGKGDKCRWMREPRTMNFKGKEFVSGGYVMPDAPLNFVPERNLQRLNEVSQNRWKELKTKK